jgi:glycosyltransferase involved in cell wall biosynthesis
MALTSQRWGRYYDQKSALTAIVPAYNECGRISKVLYVLLQAQIVDEIIVVDDGSTDGMTEEVLELSQSNPRLKFLRHSANRGKGQAIFTGLYTSNSPVLLLLDADLINLTVQHVEALVHPVLSGEADMTIGLFQQGSLWTDLSHRATPWLSGQRCVRADLIRYLPKQSAQGYGFETCLTILARQKKWRVKRVPWIGVTHMVGLLQRNRWSGFQRKAMMYRDIFWSWLVIELGWSWPGLRNPKIPDQR